MHVWLRCIFFSWEEVGKYRVEGDNLAVCLLDLPQGGKEVPETGLGDNVVGGKYAHAVKLRGGVDLGGEEAPDDLVLLKATCDTEGVVLATISIFFVFASLVSLLSSRSSRL